jgi:hypothetical protein
VTVVATSERKATLGSLPGRVRPKTEYTGRVQVITRLLENYADFATADGPGGIQGDGDATPCMSKLYTPSVRELERLLCVMRNDRHRSLLTLASGERVSVRSLWWHLTERYIRCTVSLKDYPVKRKAKGGKTLTVVERRSVARYSREVRPALVDLGVQWLAENWALRSEPMLPRELVAA